MAFRVSEELNRICTEAGVQCTVTLDPQDFKKIFQFRSFSLNSVEISYGKQTYILQPSSTFVFKSLDGVEPKITKWFVWYSRVT
jgi:hypothetical protein